MPYAFFRSFFSTDSMKLLIACRPRRCVYQFHGQSAVWADSRPEAHNQSQKYSAAAVQHQAVAPLARFVKLGCIQQG